jgi:hypothetical protein
MNADKEFVPYQPSLDMKSIGFNEPCLSYFDSRLEQQLGNFDFTEIKGYNESDSALSPLYQQAFRWFREKYGIEGVTQRAEDFMWYKWTIYQYNENGKKYVFDWCEYETYEEAELACLIKLIEIVKNK